MPPAAKMRVHSFVNDRAHPVSVVSLKGRLTRRSGPGSPPPRSLRFCDVAERLLRMSLAQVIAATDTGNLRRNGRLTRSLFLLSGPKRTVTRSCREEQREVGSFYILVGACRSRVLTTAASLWSRLSPGADQIATARGEGRIYWRVCPSSRLESTR